MVLAQAVGPSPYTSAASSPWGPGLLNNFQLEDFEDRLFNAPDVTKSASTIQFGGGNTDSVDGDDGSIDGSGLTGTSLFFSGGPTGITFTFTGAALPTHAGMVWTDGSGGITFEAWDQNNVSLGTIAGTHADGGFLGSTAEDRFYSWINAGGISRINMRNSFGGIEIDHLQYGYGVVPEPASIGALGLGMLLLARRRK